jgi:hypothetical protein
MDVLSGHMGLFPPSYPVRGKTITVEVEVVDAPLDYNLLLG